MRGHGCARISSARCRTTVVCGPLRQQGSRVSTERIRAALALWSAQAVGADPAVGLLAAIAGELVHDFSLVHDGIMDNGRLRQGRPAVWTIYGIGPAVLLGNALHTFAQTILSETELYGHRAAARLATTVCDSCRGQAADFQFEHRDRSWYRDTCPCWKAKPAR